ncbi:MAG: alpha/beta hydrolase [Thermovirgaceae bacterium]
MSPQNKYGRLARMLNFRGAISAVVETSRLRRDRETFGDDRESWARAAFRGKTFAADHADVLEGLSLVHSLLPEKDLWIWGFSLGGIHAVTAAGGSSKAILREGNQKAPLPEFHFSGIVTSGSGDRVRPGAKRSLELPILDSMPPESILHEAARNLSAGYFVSFYGSLDETFSEESCKEIFREVPLPEARKAFHVLKGVDHPFRHLYGHPSLKPLEMMTEKLATLLHPGPPRFQSEIF